VPLKPERAYTRTVAPFEKVWIDKGETALIALCAPGPLVIRRRFPLAPMFLMLAMFSIFPIPLVLVGLAALIAAHSAAVYSPYHRLALCALPFVAIELLSRRYLLLLPGDKFLTLFLIVPLPIGFTFYGSEIRRQAGTDVAARKRTREEMQKEAIRPAVEGERSRIARELHDVVTHNVSVMVVMAGAARKTLGKSRAQATQALLEVEAVGRSAMAELRRAMGLLTESAQEQHLLAPPPGLDQLGPLVSRIRATGMPIRQPRPRRTASAAARPGPHRVPRGAGGASNAELAARLLHLSEATIKTHVARILAKLQLRDRAQAVVAAYETGLVMPGSLTTAEAAGAARIAEGLSRWVRAMRPGFCQGWDISGALD
jgi:Histidine kinase/Bacterial regulatory proteins, luxR family